MRARVASSFAASLVGLFSWALKPKTHTQAVKGIFPAPSSHATAVEDVVLEGVIAPAFRGLEGLMERLRSFQQGLTQVYILLVLITLVALLATLLPLGDMVARLFAR